ncbi:S8 family serine peptidase [Silvanigrella aquatica]|uniref:P/Homo B domain-containing protein n=1 Tax=Silvanigrella aquatica TaxID=1915309 RepID=A0A1L4D3M9_9BACT|nr:S8 family serine peptidase [Silvanigrella aquatica]APJ04813.1 hypothetical protein AXG55_13260 [Silvanigrella aquatica]
MQRKFIFLYFFLFQFITGCGEKKLPSLAGDQVNKEENYMRSGSCNVREKSVSTKNLFKEEWFIKNSGSYSYSKLQPMPGIDLNIPLGKYDGTGVNVLVSDTGVDLYHQDLEPNVLPNSSINIMNYLTLKTLENKPDIGVGEESHGTSVAGIIGATENRVNKFRGIAPKVKIASANIISDLARKKNSTSTYALEQEIYNLAARKSIQIINESFGNGAFTFSFFDEWAAAGFSDDIVKNSQKNNNSGFVVVRSAGNYTCDLQYAKKIAEKRGIKEDPFMKLYLAYINAASFSSLSVNQREALNALRPHLSMMDARKEYPYVITVAAVSANGSAANYSSLGSNIWISGIGGGESSTSKNDNIFKFSSEDYGSSAKILTTNISCQKRSKIISNFDEGNLSENKNYNYTSEFDGTSAAAPSISGVIALMLHANSHLSLRDIKYILAKTANKDKLVPNPKPSCIKILERVGNLNSSFASKWDLEWTTNAAGFNFHNFYGFGLADAEKAINLVHNFKSPYANKSSKEKSDKSIELSAPIVSGTSIENIINFTNDIVIESVQITPYINTTKSDGLSIELYSPSNTRSVILYPGNSLIELNPDEKSVQNYPYPVNDFKKNSDKYAGTYLTNAFFEENAKGNWKIVVSNYNSKETVDLKGWKINIIGHDP